MKDSYTPGRGLGTPMSLKSGSKKQENTKCFNYWVQLSIGNVLEVTSEQIIIFKLGTTGSSVVIVRGQCLLTWIM